MADLSNPREALEWAHAWGREATDRPGGFSSAVMARTFRQVSEFRAMISGLDDQRYAHTKAVGLANADAMDRVLAAYVAAAIVRGLRRVAARSGA